MLEEVAVRLDDVPAGLDDRRDLRDRRLVDLRPPALGDDDLVDRPALVPLEPGAVLTEVVEEETSLVLESHDAGHLAELAGVEAASGDGELDPDPPTGAGDQLELVDREAQLVEPADPVADGLPVAGTELGRLVELGPQGPVSPDDPLGGGHGVVDRVVAALRSGEVGQAEGDVLPEDLEVVFPLAVRQGRVDLAGLGIDEVGLDAVAVPAEERVGERAVAPVDAAAVEVDEEPGHGVEEPIAITARAEREPLEEPAVLEGVDEEVGDEDPGVPLRRLGEPGRRHGRQALLFQVPEDLELAASRLERLLLEGIESSAGLHEADEVPRWADVEVPERRVGVGPGGERQVPRELEQAGVAGPQAEVGERLVRLRLRGISGRRVGRGHRRPRPFGRIHSAAPSSLWRSLRVYRRRWAGRRRRPRGEGRPPG